MNILLTCALLFRVFQSESLAEPPKDEIYNGNPVNTRNDDFEWLIYQYINSPDAPNTFCSGSLIQTDPPVILTAAHCTHKLVYSNNEWLLRTDNGLLVEVSVDFHVGATFINDNLDPLVTLSLKPNTRIVFPDNYDRDFWYEQDISLVFFVSDDLSQAEKDALAAINPPTLVPALDNQNAQCCATGDIFTVMGYGKNGPGNWDFVNQLQRTTMRYVNNADCSQRALNQGYVLDIASNEMCASGGDSGSCGGDSGGPMLVGDSTNGRNRVLAGINSWGIGLCQLDKLSGEVSVAYWRNWIDDKIEKYTDYSPALDDLQCTNWPTPGTDARLRCLAGNTLNDGYTYFYNHGRGTEYAVCGPEASCWCCRAQIGTTQCANWGATEIQFPDVDDYYKRCLSNNALQDDGFAYFYNDGRDTSNAVCGTNGCWCCRWDASTAAVQEMVQEVAMDVIMDTGNRKDNTVNWFKWVFAGIIFSIVAQQLALKCKNAKKAGIVEEETVPLIIQK